MDNKIVNIDCVDAYNRLFGLPTRHPLVTVVDLNNAPAMIDNVRMHYGVYALF